MNLVIACTAKSCDGLFYYSYEYASRLNARLVVIPHPKHTEDSYIKSAALKYTNNKQIEFEYYANPDDVILVMGRSMITLPFKEIQKYTDLQLFSLKDLFSGNIISVYSENHPYEYYDALNYWSPKKIVDLCDTDIYPNGTGDHFEKRINFSIYKEPKQDVQAEYAFSGTNYEYYETAQKYLDDYPDHFIMAYAKCGFLNHNDKYLPVPSDNFLGKFNCYVYCKETFDPAPRLLQECMYFGKKICYNRDSDLKDGGYYYIRRGVKKIDVEPITNAMKEFTHE